MKLRLLLSGIALLMTTMTVVAVPAKPGIKKIFRQADGTTIELTLCGDEHFSFYTDDAGQAYRLLADEKLERLTDREITDIWTARKAERMANVNKTRNNATRRAGKPSNVTSGKHKGLVILIQFQDVKFVSDNPKLTFNRYFNEEGYSDGGNTGSVKDYFLKQSYRQLEIDFDIAGPYTANASLHHYGAKEGTHSDGRVLELIMEAIDAASKDVDFSNYDWDNDGEVDQVYIICAGYDEAEGADEDYIWPHEWALSAQGIQRHYNGKKINTYGISTELWGNERTNPNNDLAGIGAACHEFSHCLGLPDFYDTTYSGNFGMYNWDVMDHGCYNGNSCTPAGYTSYERWFCGWMEPTELKDFTRINDMKPLVTAPEAYVLYNEANRNEYYLLENRQLVDFDKGLPGHGLLVLHVDYDPTYWGYLVNAEATRQRMTIIPADCSKTKTLSSLAGDPYPGTSGNTLLNNFSKPFAQLYNENIDGRKLMSKSLDNITESEDGLISFVACRQELKTPEPDGGKAIEGEASFTVTWPAVSGALSYEVQVTEMGTVPDTPEEGLLYAFDFEGMKSKTAGFTDVSRKLKDYGLPNWSGSNIFTSPNKMRLGTSTSAGWVRTPQSSTPESSELTVVIRADVYRQGSLVEGKLQLAYGNMGDQVSWLERKFEVTKDTFLVFTFKVPKDYYYIDVRPESCMYLTYLAVYDGTWSAEQLGLTSTAARLNAPRRTKAITTYETETNSYTFKDVNTRHRFYYSVRAVGEEKTYSDWSAEQMFVFSGSTGISGVKTDNENFGPVYDLHGRNVGTDFKALNKGIYIINGKKVVK